MSEFLQLLLLIRDAQARIARTTEILLKMREEGRDEMTDEERSSLQADDDEARQRLLDAIEEAGADPAEPPPAA